MKNKSISHRNTLTHMNSQQGAARFQTGRQISAKEHYMSRTRYAPGVNAKQPLSFAGKQENGNLAGFPKVNNISLEETNKRNSVNASNSRTSNPSAKDTRPPWRPSYNVSNARESSAVGNRSAGLSKATGRTDWAAKYLK
ncbi:PREDICTED: uncharacterized protein LOC106814095 [Priapulus caudatus]|uniref:Uncharacterized protein LOC106814095 n=1 Tax=Priapulus caudatus TaxID=37621 RepID=A0ABM1ENT5_PRICU|nr:PREDICTED: uncharacterized protein LOC106814095 [Priapulus caudatus]